MTHLLIDRFRFDSFSSESDRPADSSLLTRFGRTIFLFFLVTPPEATVERAWTRGLETGRFKAVEDLLYHNVEAFTGMPQLFFFWARSEGRNVHFEFLDNSVEKGRRPPHHRQRLERRDERLRRAGHARRRSLPQDRHRRQGPGAGVRGGIAGRGREPRLPEAVPGAARRRPVRRSARARRATASWSGGFGRGGRRPRTRRSPTSSIASAPDGEAAVAAEPFGLAREKGLHRSDRSTPPPAD